MNDSATAVVSRDHKALLTEVCHDINLILRHSPERLVNVVRAITRLAGVSVALKLRENDHIVFCELRGNLMPSDMGLRMAMNQKKRRPIALCKHPDGRSRCLLIAHFESRK
jgi:hypothetical protein